MKAFFQKNWIHFAAIAIMYIVTIIYCKPVTEGYGVKQHDIVQYQGMSHEAKEYKNQFSDEPLWTNSMFGGMPLMQISVTYSGNLIAKALNVYYTTTFGRPVDIIFMHMLGFYLFAMLLGMNPVLGLIGAISMAFASYEIIIIQAGHNAKAMASAFMAPILGAFIRYYRDKFSLWILSLAGLFMAFEIASNHVQVTYYLAFLLIGLGIYFFVKAFKDKGLKDFFVKTIALIGIFLLAGIINSGNLLLTNDYAKHTIRGKNDVTINPDGTPVKNQSAGLDRDYITQWSYGIGETFTLISPNIKGGGSFALAGSQFESVLDNVDISSQSKQEIGNYGAYWGDQPFTSGPVYIGMVVFVLAFLGLFFWKSKMKWVFLAVSILAVALSWGKNFMGLTNFFIDYVPAYSMFRAVTIILILVELCAVALALFFVDDFIKNRATYVENKKKLLIVLGGLVVFSLVMRSIGNSIDSFSGASEKEQLANISSQYTAQIMSMDPQVLMSNYQLDVNNAQQVKQFVDMQVKQVEDKMSDLRVVRQQIYKDSWTRSAAFAFFTGLALFLFVSTSMTPIVLSLSLLLLTTIDLIPVAYDYLGSQKDVNDNYKYWEEVGLIKYPVMANEGDYQIMEMELANNKAIGDKIDKAGKEANALAIDLSYTGQARTNLVDAAKFSALNFASSYRVFDQQDGFNSSRSSYFHKAIGGYHGAKLRNFQNLVDFHIAKGNNTAFDMLNTKYFIQQGANGERIARLNPNAAGNAWVVKNVRTYKTPNEEILALGTTFNVENTGTGALFVNGTEVKNATVYGSEKLQYIIKGTSDSISVPLSNGMREGMEVAFVMDANGKTDLVMPSVFDTEEGKQSFLKLASIKVEETFDLKDEVVMLESEASKLSAKSYSGEGVVTMTDYLPNKMKYTADLKDKQLVVFSEVFYDEGWKLTVDGKEVPILKVNYLLRGAEVPAGKHQLEMTFDLPKYHTLNTVSLIGSLMLILLLAGGFYNERKKKGNRISEN
ncbi:MAG: YfhO family protein [Crocinitomicaceae bacterium]|nr:YfhO family protein [Crocinitomicaceae bacterium]